MFDEELGFSYSVQNKMLVIDFYMTSTAQTPPNFSKKMDMLKGEQSFSITTSLGASLSEMFDENGEPFMKLMAKGIQQEYKFDLWSGFFKVITTQLNKMEEEAKDDVQSVLIHKFLDKII